MMKWRPDLSFEPSDHSHRQAGWLVWDEFASRGTWVSDRVKQLVDAGTANNNLEPNHRELQSIADLGLLRTRIKKASHRSWTRWMAIRLGWLDSSTLVRWTDPILGWLFSRATAVFALAITTLVISGLLLRCDRLFSDIQTMSTFYASASPLALTASWIGLKVVHEWGHASVCFRQGYRPGRTGLMLFFGYPCPFVDVSSINRCQDWRKRAAVMAGGMYCEYLIACSLAILWLLSTEVSTRHWLLHGMIMGGVSTIVFNANPLMRYDGYYILGDILGVPDLRSHAASQNRLSWRLFSLAGTLYRTTVLVTLGGLGLWYLQQWNLSRVTLFTLALIAATYVFKSVSNHLNGQTLLPAKEERTTRWRSLFVGALCCLALIVPLPRWRSVSGRLVYLDSQVVYASVDGTVKGIESDWFKRVAEGQPLVRLDSVERTLQTERARLRVLVASHQQNEDQRRETLDLPKKRSSLTNQAIYQSLQMQYVVAKRQSDQLTISSGQEGWWIPPTQRIASIKKPTNDRLEKGSRVTTGTALGRIVGGEKPAIEWLSDQLSEKDMDSIQSMSFSLHDSGATFQSDFRTWERVRSGNSIAIRIPVSTKALDLKSALPRQASQSPIERLNPGFSDSNLPVSAARSSESVIPSLSRDSMLSHRDSNQSIPLVDSPVEVVLHLNHQSLAKRLFAWIQDNLGWSSI
ncbi:MAG: hypothetical protein AAF664_11745 [Planctomycetota bacterium]